MNLTKEQYEDYNELNMVEKLILSEININTGLDHLLIDGESERAYDFDFLQMSHHISDLTLSQSLDNLRDKQLI